VLSMCRTRFRSLRSLQSSKRNQVLEINDYQLLLISNYGTVPYNRLEAAFVKTEKAFLK
jgi:hypothetical protein